MWKLFAIFRRFDPDCYVNFTYKLPTITAYHVAITKNVSFIKTTIGKMCNRPMGLQNHRLKNHLMTSSSRWDNYHGPYRARLNIRRHGRYIGAWSSQYNNRYQWLQVDFTRPAKIIRISTQGRQDTNQWVTQYYVTRSLDAVNFRPYKERNNVKVSVCLYIAHENFNSTQNLGYKMV